MKENNNVSKDANVAIDTNAFIRQVAFAGSKESASEPMQTGKQTDNQTAITNDTPESVEEKPARRKKGQTADYESSFLSRNELRDRQGLYISRDNYETLQTLVRVIRRERLSVSGLVDNIVSHHIELYGDEMNRIYDEHSRKPIKQKK